jgi:hypothetical protein
MHLHAISVKMRPHPATRRADALAECHQSRDRGDPCGGRDALRRLGVELAVDDVGVAFCGLLEDRGELMAGSTLRCPEINQDDVVVLDGALEVVVRELGGCHDVPLFEAVVIPASFMCDGRGL